jgi:hypothetical protein
MGHGIYDLRFAIADLKSAGSIRNRQSPIRNFLDGLAAIPFDRVRHRRRKFFQIFNAALARLPLLGQRKECGW